MFDDIYKLLSSGEKTPDEIARVFTDALNAAEKRVTEEQEAKRKAEEEAKAAAAAKEAEDAAKRAMMGKVTEAFWNYLDKFYPNLVNGLDEKAEEVLVDYMINIVDKCSTLGDLAQNVELSATNNGNKVNIKFQFDEPIKKEAHKFFDPFDLTHWIF